jgi:hypothetical protein
MLTVAAQTSEAFVNTTVVKNQVTVSPVSISLGSVVQATGTVTAGGEPMPNALVALHMGDLKLADAKTNENGDYSFNVPVWVNYFPAAFSNGAAVYTVVEPQNASLINTPSAVTTVSVDLLPLYFIIALVAVAILVGLYVFTQRMRAKVRAKPAAEEKVKGQVESPLSDVRAIEEGPAVALATPQDGKTAEERQPEVLEPALPAKSAEPPIDETPHEITTQPPESAPPEVAETGVLKQAHDFFMRGNDRQAVNTLYDSVISDIATSHEVTIASYTTHWETYRAIEAVVPEIQDTLHTLTTIYEHVNYAGKALTEEQRNAAVKAFRAIKTHVESANT